MYSKEGHDEVKNRVAVPTSLHGPPSHLVPDVDVCSLSQEQLHLVQVFVLGRPDHGCPPAVILDKVSQHVNTRHHT